MSDRSSCSQVTKLKSLSRRSYFRAGSSCRCFALRQVAVDRAFQEAVDDVYRDIVDSDVIHEREDLAAS
jgi:hypothetical protein